MQEWMVQIIISLGGVITTLASVILILNKKLGNSNGDEYKDSVQSQISLGTDGTKTLSERFDAQVGICGERWIDAAKAEGRVEAYMMEIRDRLMKIEVR